MAISNPTHGGDVAVSQIGEDLRCADCGYNLRTLAEDGRCPECGLAIAVSRRYDVEVAARRENGRSQASLLMAIAIGLWCVGGLVFVAGVFIFNYADDMGDDYRVAERAITVLMVLFAASSGMMLIISLLLALSAGLHRDYDNTWSFAISAVINPMSLLIVAYIVAALL